jgi:hypothetical protein
MQTGHSLFRCPICRSQTMLDPQHHPLVIDGEPVCHRSLCKEKAHAILDSRQRYELPLRLNPG